ncbi:MAG: transglutaminase-like domain-containing protein, partial [Bacillota bacterium]
GHAPEVSEHASITEIGTEDNVLDIDIINSDDEDVTEYYSIDYDPGVLEVIPRVLVVSTPSAEKVYDGDPLEKDDWEISSGSLMDDHTLDVTVTGSITEVGQTYNTFDYEITDAEDRDVSEYYSVDENTGVLEVLSEEVSLKIVSGSDSKPYDGSPLTHDEWELKEGDLLEGHSLDVDVTGEITEVGSTDNTFTYTITDQEGNDVSEDLYDVHSKYGVLRIIDDDEKNGSNSESDTDISNGGSLEGGMDLSGTIFKVHSEISSSWLYLRNLSYGDYNQSGWDAAEVYHSQDGVSPLSFPGLAAGDTVNPAEIEIKTVMSGLSYYLPQYATDGFHDNDNDVYASHTYSSGYTIQYIPFEDYDHDAMTLEGTEYENQEKEYREHVYETYLDLPKGTKSAMLDIADDNGLHPDNNHIIEDVESFVRNSATYNKAYTPMPDDVDKAVYFLEHSREGICQHFATSATVMYRSLGIPARYATGYATPTKSDEWVEVSNTQGHAWVEVYMDGIGWMPVEVTPGDLDGSGSSDGSDGGSQPDEDPETIEISSKNASKVYDGSPLTHHEYSYEGELEEGHSLDIEFEGSITQVGKTDNRFTATIQDENGEDVSDDYSIEPYYGTLEVVADNDRPILEIQVSDIKKTYNGEVIEHDPDDYWIPSDNLPEGYSIDLDINGELKDAGKIRTHADERSVRVLDENGMDVTHTFNLVFYEGSIEVQRRTIEVTSFSAEKYYDGEPLTSDVHYLSRGSLAEGEEIAVDITGSQTEVGSSENTIASIQVFDGSDQDVTDNYKIKPQEGHLTVLED